MDELEFKNIKDIGNFRVRFKFFSIPANGGYQATFHIYNKDDELLCYQSDFILNGTDYNTDIIIDCINEKYNNLEDCFKKIGIKYLKEKIFQNNLKNEVVNITSILI